MATRNTNITILSLQNCKCCCQYLAEYLIDSLCCHCKASLEITNTWWKCVSCVSLSGRLFCKMYMLCVSACNRARVLNEDSMISAGLNWCQNQFIKAWEMGCVTTKHDGSKEAWFHAYFIYSNTFVLNVKHI